MTKPVWKRSAAGNPMLSFWELRVIVFPMKGGCWNYNILGLDTGVAWGPKFATEADARTAAEVAFLEHKAAHDWETPGRQAFEERLDAERTSSTATPVTSRHQIDQQFFNGHYARLDAHADHETAKAVHLDGCDMKDEHCHSDRCGECWSQVFWVPKSKLYFDRNEQQWYIDRNWAEQHDIHVVEDDYADALEHGGDK